MSPSEERPPERPEYKVYRSRPRLTDRFRKPDLSSLRRDRPRGRYRMPVGGDWRRWLRIAGIAALIWIVISFVAFAISAQIQKGKLDDDVGDVLAGNPFLIAAPQNILLLGGDQRGKVGRKDPGATGDDPIRADTIMVVRAGGGAFRKLSIPRDTAVEIPGFEERHKINAAFAIDDANNNGNPALIAETVEEFLDIKLDQVVVVDFDGMVDFIDTLGGIDVDLEKPVCGELNGGRENGGQTINFKKRGEYHLNGGKALALARIRHNECDPGEDDRDRAERQQLILDGIKGRLTSITRLPINFLKGPIIGWNAPKAIVSSMGGITMPQLAFASVIGGGDSEVLEPSGFESTVEGDGLSISEEERKEKVDQLLGRG